MTVDTSSQASGSCAVYIMTRCWGKTLVSDRLCTRVPIVLIVVDYEHSTCFHCAGVIEYEKQFHFNAHRRGLDLKVSLSVISNEK